MAQVKETEFYDLLGVPPDASKTQIRKAYYTKAKGCHPDKHPGDDDKEAQFKALSEAYQALFDDESREVYDKHGREGLQPSGFADPRDIFATMFGGPEFEAWIGTLAMCAPVDEALSAQAEEAMGALFAKAEELRAKKAAGELSPEAEEAARAELERLQAEAKEKEAALKGAMEAVQAQRVSKCAAALHAYIAPYVSGGEPEREAWRAAARADLARLRAVSMGEPMLNTIGYIYTHHTHKVLGRHGVGVHRLWGTLESARELTHKLSEGVSTVGKVVSLASAQSKLARDAEEHASARHKLSQEKKDELAQRISENAFQLMWKITKRDIEDTLRAVVDAELEQAPGSSAAAPATEADAPAGAAAADSAAPAASEGAAAISAIEIDLPPRVLARARAIVELGQIFGEALTFTQFVNREKGPSRAEKAQAALEEKLRAKGVDVDAVKKTAADAGSSAYARAAEAGTAAGAAVNKLFGFGKKSGSRPSSAAGARQGAPSTAAVPGPGGGSAPPPAGGSAGSAS